MSWGEENLKLAGIDTLLFTILHSGQVFECYKCFVTTWTSNDFHVTRNVFGIKFFRRFAPAVILPWSDIIVPRCIIRTNGRIFTPDVKVEIVV